MGNQLNSCTFLRACTTEALRLLPQFAGIPTRRELADGVSVDGYQFPEGTIVDTPIYTIQNDQRCYPHPIKFEPGRLLEITVMKAQTANEWATSFHRLHSARPVSVRGRLLRGYGLGRNVFDHRANGV